MWSLTTAILIALITQTVKPVCGEEKVITHLLLLPEDWSLLKNKEKLAIKTKINRIERKKKEAASVDSNIRAVNCICNNSNDFKIN